MSTPERVTHRDVQEILRTFRESGWAAMTLEMDGMRITVGKDGPPSAPARTVADAPAPSREAAPAATPPPAPPAPVAATAAAGNGGASPATAAHVPATDTSDCIEVSSPTVGAFWMAPSPGEPPFVQVGQKVKAGDQLAIVEVMKLMNPIVAPRSGEIVQICAGNADLVEFEQPLFLIRPSDG